MRHEELDARGLSCPLPVLKAQKRLRGLDGPVRLVVLTTDPKAPGDFGHFCEERGYGFEVAEEPGGHRVTVTKLG